MQSERRSLRVAWLAPFNLRLLSHRLPPLRRDFHPSPWITNGARALTRNGEIELHLVTYDRDLDRDYEFDEQGIWFHILRARLPLVPRAPSLYRLDLPIFRAAIQRIDPDVVHGHGTENLFSLAAVLSGRPSVVSMQAVMAELVKTQPLFSRVWLHQTILRTLERQTLKGASRIIVEAPFVADIVKHVNRNIQITVVGNVVSEEFFTASSPPGPRGNRLMYVGSLIRTKGVAEAITAFHRLAPTYRDLELHVVGTGPANYVDRLAAMAGSGAGSNRIHFRGFLTSAEIVEEYGSAAVVVVPTYYDTSPNVVSEAMVAGVPVIASAVGGLPYMLDRGNAGQLVPPHDPDALAAAIARNMQNPEWATRAAEVGQQLARRRYSSDAFVSAVTAVYREACSSGGRPHR